MVKVSTRPHKTATPVSEAVTAVTEPPIPPHTVMATAPRGSDENESLRALLDQSTIIVKLLITNFDGDGAFESPSEAPGLPGMVQCVVTLLTAAECRANNLLLSVVTRDAIHQAAALAIHLAALSKEELEEGKRGFNFGDAFVATCYCTLKQLTDRAIDELTSEAGGMRVAVAPHHLWQ